jgi:hypothetical protein
MIDWKGASQIHMINDFGVVRRYDFVLQDEDLLLELVEVAPHPVHQFPPIFFVWFTPRLKRKWERLIFVWVPARTLNSMPDTLVIQSM